MQEKIKVLIIQGAFWTCVFAGNNGNVFMPNGTES
jgi:hypothetical protein